MAIPWTQAEQQMQRNEDKRREEMQDKVFKEYVAKIQASDKLDYDTVTKPKHYMLFDEETVEFFADNNKGIEVRDVIAQLVDKIPLEGRAWGGHSGLFVSDYVQMMQYFMRFMDKNGKEDLEKGRYYLDKLIQSY